jgi:hypothetical protein
MNENRETANAETYPAILRLAGDIAPFDDAQGRLRQGGTFSVFFTKKIHVVNFFVKKIDQVPCCRRRIGLLSG